MGKLGEEGREGNGGEGGTDHVPSLAQRAHVACCRVVDGFVVAADVFEAGG